MKCRHCGAGIPAGRDFCPRCGRHAGVRRAGWPAAYLYRDRRRRLRRLRMLRLAGLALAAIAALALLIGLLRRVPAPSPAPSPQGTAIPVETESPQAGAELSGTEAPRATQAPQTAEPTATIEAPLPNPADYGEAPPATAISTRGDLIDAYWWMIHSGHDIVRLDALDVPEDTIAEVADLFSNYFDAYSYTFADPALRVQFKPGLAALIAIQRGEVEALDADAREVAQQAQAAIASLALDGLPPIEREAAVHDYILRRCAYQFDESDDASNSALGFFNNGLCRCAGYVDTFRLLGRLAGLDVEMIGGPTTRDAEDSKGHAWNLIRLDGLWYVVDLTWDDMVDAAGGIERVYFNLPPASFGGTRSFDEDVFPAGRRAEALDGMYWYNRPEYAAATVDEAVAAAVRQLDADGRARVLYTGENLARETAAALQRHYQASGSCVELSEDIDLHLYLFSMKTGRSAEA